MGITWNDCVDIIPVMARRHRNIIEHQNACADLIRMFLTHFKYPTHSRESLKITDILSSYYMNIVEGKKIFRRERALAENVLSELSRIIHA